MTKTQRLFDARWPGKFEPSKNWITDGGLHREGSSMTQTTARFRIPTKDDAFMWRHAGRMFTLLSGVDNHPPGCAINEALRIEIQKLFQDAYADGIDIIGASECGLQEKTYYSGEINNG